MMSIRSNAAGRFAVYIAVVVMLVLSLLLGGCRGSGEQKESRKPPVEVGQGDKTKAGASAVKPEPAVEKPDRPKLSVVTREVTLSWEEAGKLKMQATAREIVGNELTGTGTMKDAKVLWYDNGQLTTVMNAPVIEAQQSTRTLIASGGVVVRSVPRNTVVKSQWLKWQAREHKITGNGGVTVTSDIGTVKAAGLVADTELKTIKFVSQGNGGSASFTP